MNRENFEFLYKMFPHHKIEDLDIILVNQTSADKQLISKIPTIKVINSFEKGVSKSRNLALENSSSDWCLISDDDLVYLKGFENKIFEGIAAFHNSGGVIFQAEIDANNLMRSYPKQSKRVLSIQEKFHVASFEMLLNKKKITDMATFNESFGLGSNMFDCGEEQILMNDISNLNYDVSFFKKTIVQHPWLSTGRDYEKEGRYFTKGAIYAKLFPRNYKRWIFIQLFFDLKQGHISFKEIYSSFKNAINGVNALK